MFTLSEIFLTVYFILFELDNDHSENVVLFYGLVLHD